MRRRQYLGVVVGAAASTGCLGSPATGVVTPDPELSPAALVPPTPPGMSADERVTLDTSDMPAEAGEFVQFTAAAGVRYYVEVLRWPTEAAARSGVDLYRGYRGESSEWRIYVVRGVFSWAGATLGGDVETIVSILGASEWFSPEWVRANDQLEA